MDSTNDKIKSFKDLNAWKEGHIFVLMIYKITKSFSKDELFALTNQMRQAAVSATSNIAEGFSRQSYKEKIQFYSTAQGSVTEPQNQLLIAKDVKYISSEDFLEIDIQAEKVHKIFNGLIRSSKSFIHENP